MTDGLKPARDILKAVNDALREQRQKALVKEPPPGEPMTTEQVTMYYDLLSWHVHKFTSNVLVRMFDLQAIKSEIIKYQNYVAEQKKAGVLTLECSLEERLTEKFLVEENDIKENNNVD